MLKGRFSEPCGLAGKAVLPAHTALPCQGTCHGRGTPSPPGACVGVGITRSGSSYLWSASAGDLCRLSKCPGSGHLGSVQRTPGDQEKPHPTLSCHSLLHQFQEGGFAQMVSFHLATATLLRAISPAGRNPGSPEVTRTSAF